MPLLASPLASRVDRADAMYVFPGYSGAGERIRTADRPLTRRMLCQAELHRPTRPVLPDKEPLPGYRFQGVSANGLSVCGLRLSWAHGCRASRRWTVSLDARKAVWLPQRMMGETSVMTTPTTAANAPPHAR